MTSRPRIASRRKMTSRLRIASRTRRTSRLRTISGRRTTSQRRTTAFSGATRSSRRKMRGSARIPRTPPWRRISAAVRTRRTAAFTSPTIPLRVRLPRMRTLQTTPGQMTASGTMTLAMTALSAATLGMMTPGTMTLKVSARKRTLRPTPRRRTPRISPPADWTDTGR